MRIRSDFVTNSSSTNFILKSVTSGTLPLIPSFENLSRFLDKYEFVQSRQNWAKFTRFLPCKRRNGVEGVVEAKISREVEWNERKRKHEVVDFILIEVKSPVISIGPQTQICLKEATSILEKIVEYGSIDFAVLFFSQHVHKLVGDNWNNKEPEGVYCWSHEVLRSQTKVGDIFIVDSKVRTKLSEPEVDTPLINDVKELMKNPGYFLPEKGTK